MIVNELGDFVARTTAQSLPREVADAVKLRILDVLASALVGFELGNHRMLLPLLGGAGDATFWGAGRRLAVRDATLINSFLAHSTYLEDGSRFTGGHPSSAVIPGALALAESEGRTGDDLIVAVAVGYEVFLRLGRAIFPATVARGFQSTAVLAAVATAAACASLLRLQPEAAKNALAIACSQGVGLKEALRSSASQPLQVGRSCEGGFVAAMFAREGAAGADTIVENGFLKAFSGNAPSPALLDGLGTQYSIAETYFKLHGGCRGTHAPVDVVQALVNEHAIALDDIESIVIGIAAATLANDVHHPRTGEQAQFSASFAAAAALIHGNASIFQFTDDRLADPRIQSLMAKIDVQVDPVLDAAFPGKRGASAEIRLTNGKRYSSRMDNARGEPEFPLTASDVDRKFIALTQGILGSNAQRVRDMVLALETVADLKALGALLQKGSTAPEAAAFRRSASGR